MYTTRPFVLYSLSYLILLLISAFRVILILSNENTDYTISRGKNYFRRDREHQC